MILIGIDPGTTTGMGIWHTDGEVLDLQSGTLIEMYKHIERMHTTFSYPIHLRIEDARQRKWYGNATKGKLQGVGSVKRDCSIWEEICEYHKWSYKMVHPIKGSTKWDHDQFCRITGWDGQTNEHKRDALLLVWGLKNVQL